jgi:hypothetical protein
MEFPMGVKLMAPVLMANRKLVAVEFNVNARILLPQKSFESETIVRANETVSLKMYLI